MSQGSTTQDAKSNDKPANTSIDSSQPPPFPSSFPSTNRILVTIFLIMPLCFYYWEDLLQQMDGSSFKSAMIVCLAITCGLVDLNGLSGQPESDDHDHDHHD